MLRLENVDEIISRIRKTEKPMKIFIFGSYARNMARNNSDLDLIVIKNYRKSKPLRARKILFELRDIPLETDVVCFTPQEVAKGVSVKNSFIYNIMQDAKQVYAK